MCVSSRICFDGGQDAFVAQELIPSIPHPFRQLQYPSLVMVAGRFGFEVLEVIVLFVDATSDGDNER